MFSRLVAVCFGWRALGWLILGGGIVLAGCGSDSVPPNPQVPSFRGISLKVGAVDDPAILAGVGLLRGEWEASRGGQITVLEKPIAVAPPLDADVVIFSGQRLGDLVDGDLLAVIPNSAVMPPKPVDSQGGETTEPAADRPPGARTDDFQFMDFAPVFREQVSQYGPDRLALPCGGTALVLVYRRDAFENDTNRAAARQAGLELKPPRTWIELDALARFFENRDWSGDGKPDHGIVLAMGPDSEGLGDAVFLARAASLGQHRDQYSFLFDSDDFTPRVQSPPFVEALKGVVAWKALGPPGMIQFDAAAARESFRSGAAALLIDRAERVASWSGGKPVGVAPLPGSDRVFEPLRKQWQPASPPNSPTFLPDGGGWLIGLNKSIEGTQREAALDFMIYLASADNLNRLCAERSFPLLPVRRRQIGQGLPDPTGAPDVDARGWTVAVGETLERERVVPGLRVLGARGYLSDLSKGRLAALSGEPPETALESVAKKWIERTRELGPKRQLWHYRRSLNKLVTRPEPPPPGK